MSAQTLDKTLGIDYANFLRPTLITLCSSQNQSVTSFDRISTYTVLAAERSGIDYAATTLRPTLKTLCSSQNQSIFSFHIISNYTTLAANVASLDYADLC